MMIEFPVLLPNQDQMKLAESLDLEISEIDKVDTMLTIETAYIIAFWEDGETTHLVIDGPPYEANIKMGYRKFMSVLTDAKLKVAKYEG